MTPAESGHWYRVDGSPCYTVTGKNGETRPTTLRDARQMNLVPSVTTITRTLAKPGLENWKARQLLMAALTLPRREDETIDQFADRVIEDAAAEARAAAERGTELHGQIERWLTGEIGQVTPLLAEIGKQLADVGIVLAEGKPERSFAHPLGYGGKIDWHATGVVVDFKTKQRVEPGKQLAYTEHATQLSAYAVGVGMDLHSCRCINVFVGVEDSRVVVVEHDRAAIVNGWEIFRRALEIWQLTTGYKPVLKGDKQ